MAHHRQHQVGRGAEAGEAQILAVAQAAQRQRAPADRPGAEHRRHRGRFQSRWQGMGEGLRHGHVLRVTAVDVPAGGDERRAEVLPAAAAEVAGAAGVEDPGDAHPRAAPGHGAHHLMARNHRKPGRRRAPLDLIEFGVAHPAHLHLHQQFAGARHRLRQVHGLQRRRRAIHVAAGGQHHRFHGRQPGSRSKGSARSHSRTQPWRLA